MKIYGGIPCLVHARQLHAGEWFRDYHGVEVRLWGAGSPQVLLELPGQAFTDIVAAVPGMFRVNDQPVDTITWDGQYINFVCPTLSETEGAAKTAAEVEQLGLRHDAMVKLLLTLDKVRYNADDELVWCDDGLPVGCDY